ncbi:MAG: RNA polymerase sigma factor [Sporichthyaceae bacterium]
MAGHGDPDTTALLAAAAEGDSPAWQALVDDFLPLVWSVIRSHRLDSQLAEEVNQEVWLRLVENVGRLREPAALPGWLRTTTHRECIRARRRAWETPAGWELLQAPDPTPETEVLAEERTRVVGDALTRLSAKCQSLLRVWAWSPGAGYAEIAADLGMPVGSLGPTRSRCLERLRKRLESVGYLTAEP